MECGHDCYTIGGPWIAENPNCPIHNAAAQQACEGREEAIREILIQVWHREISADEGFDLIRELIS